jgi:serine/threonine-protein kinase
MPDTEQAPRYRVIRRLGVGGMATVTLAEDTVLGRPVALKRVHGGGDSHGLLRLKREAMVGASLNHANLVFVYDAHLRDDGDVVIVMEYVEGETLGDVIGSRGALPPGEAMRVLRGVAAALDAIHKQGIVHRDVKPANVLLGRDGTVKLADLGVADVADRTRITESGAVVGSFNYMAAEQLDGARPSRAMDVYALGAVAYEMLTGDRARPENNPLALAHAIATQPPPDLRGAWPAAPAATAAVLQRAMSANPADRPASAGELVRRLESSLGAEQATREIPSTREGPPSSRRRSRLTPVLLVLAALAVAGIIVAALGSGGQKPSATSSRTIASSSSTTSTRRPVSSSPADTVERFYEAAARHQYPQAWALADSNLRSQLGGYAAFRDLMSSVRSIAFHRAQVLPASSSSTATVALSTTSVQTDRTQQCAGSARTVRSGGAWLLDQISIGCYDSSR